MIRALTHFFGSTDGYRTLARAAGVTDAEDAALASLGFGSPRSQAEFDALESRPCMAGRLLPSGRFAITRLFPGQPDVAGRQTVERRTLVLDAEAWTALVGSDLAATLAQDSVWERDRYAAGEPIELALVEGEDLLPQPAEDERRVFDALLRAQRTGRCASLPDEPRWTRALLRLGAFLAPERAVGFGWGIGLWAVPSGVWVATLRSDAQARNTVAARLDGPWIHAKEVQALGGAGTGHSSAPLPRPVMPRQRRTPKAWMIGAAVAIALLGGTAWLLLPGRRAARPAPPSQMPSSTVVVEMPSMPRVRQPAPGRTETASTDAAASAAVPTGEPAAARPATPASPPDPEPVASTPPEAFGAASADPSFGSGGGDPGTAAPAPATPPPAATAAPAPANTGVAPAPEPRTLWDDEVDALTEAIDLASQVRAFAKRGAPDLPATVDRAQALVACSARLRAAALKLDISLIALLGGGIERRIFYADAFRPGSPRSEHGLSSRYREVRALSAFPPDVARQVALLTARFEIALAAKSLLASPLGETDPVRRVLAEEARAEGWPSAKPFEQWLYHNMNAGSVTAEHAVVFMADQFARSLAGEPGMSSLVRQLRRIAPPATGGATP